MQNYYVYLAQFDCYYPFPKHTVGFWDAVEFATEHKTNVLELKNGQFGTYYVPVWQKNN